MKLLKNEKFVCLDCETTGLDTDNDRIIEVAVVVFSYDEIYERFETLVDPKMKIPEESIKIHKINQEMVLGKPQIKDVLPKLEEFVGDYTIVGHGIDFDIRILNSEARRVGGVFKTCKVVDTLRLARFYGDSHSNTLGDLCRHFAIEVEDTHRAMGDVLLNVQIFKQLTKKFRTNADMLKVLKKPIKMQYMPFGKYKGRSFREMPVEYLYWTKKLDLDQDLSFSIAQEIKKRKEGGLFSQASNPFQSL